MASSPVSGPTEAQPGSQTASLKTETQRLLKAGINFFNANQDGWALAMFKKAYLLSGRLPESPSQARCLFNLGAAYIATGKPSKGLRCLWKSRGAVAQEEDGDFYFNVAAAYDCLREYAKAADFYRKAVHEYGTDQTRSAAEALTKLAYCLVSTGDTARAAQTFRQAGRAYQRVQLLEDAAMAMREAANYFLRSPNYSQDDVLETLEACGQLCTGIANQELLGKLYNDLGLHYAEIRRFEQAERHFDAALELCDRRGNFSIQKRAVLLQNLGATCNALEQFARSLRFHSEAADMYGALGEGQRAAQAQCIYNLATAHRQLKNYNMAEFYYQQAQKAFAEAGDSDGEARVCEELGTTHLCQGHFDQAIRDYTHALGLFEKSKEISDGPQERIREKMADVENHRANASQGHVSHSDGFLDSDADGSRLFQWQEPEPW
ncbi:tetratricopeptide repeat protein 24-like isoform X2 [Elgaria multicarinata webbii]|uniref:tetratricopeptide repeat protein 24-like isoform X2 n=1 Tax=Elgaria multicarinata webbii TaxID=159646 RepID=UPI002FCD338D